MFGAKKPMTTDQPLILTRNSDEPAVKILDNTDGGGSPIQIIRNQGNDVPTPALGTGGYSCCTKGSSGGSGGGGGKQKPPTQSLPVVDSGGDISLAQPPSAAPYRLFQGSVTIEVYKSGADPTHFNGVTTSFAGAACLPYKPPTIGAPTSALAIGDIGRKIADYIQRWNLDGYAVIKDKVSEPGRSCSPTEDFTDSLVGLPHLPDD